MKLSDLRSRIDNLDDEILSKLIERFEAAEQIAQIKVVQKLSLYDANREDEVIRRLVSKVSEPSLKPAVERVFRYIMTESLNNMTQKVPKK